MADMGNSFSSVMVLFAVAQIMIDGSANVPEKKRRPSELFKSRESLSEGSSENDSTFSAGLPQ
jgi:hypothetical protein